MPLSTKKSAVTKKCASFFLLATCNRVYYNDLQFSILEAFFALYLKGGRRLAPPRLYIVAESEAARPFVAMGDVCFDNGPGNGSLFQESAEE